MELQCLSDSARIRAEHKLDMTIISARERQSDALYKPPSDLIRREREQRREKLAPFGWVDDVEVQVFPFCDRIKPYLKIIRITSVNTHHQQSQKSYRRSVTLPRSSPFQFMICTGPRLRQRRMRQDFDEPFMYL
jgi:hypothetical protein